MKKSIITMMVLMLACAAWAQEQKMIGIPSRVIAGAAVQSMLGMNWKSIPGMDGIKSYSAVWERTGYAG